MKNHLMQLVCVCALAIGLSPKVLAQPFMVQNNAFNPCEGQEVSIKIDESGADSFFWFCDEENTDWAGTRKYKYTVAYSGGTYTVTNGVPIASLTTQMEIKLKMYPSVYINPQPLVLTIKGYRTNANNGQEENCFAAEQSITLYPRKNFSLSGPSEVNAPGNLTYTATNVGGVSYNWSVPSGWVIVSGSGTNSIVVTPNANDGNVSVTTSPAITACGYPGSIAVNVTDCFTHGETDFTFCGSSSWSAAFPTSGYGNPDKWPRMIGDFNGDGKADIIGFGNSAVNVGLSTGNAFNHSTWTTGFTYGGSGSTQTKYPRDLGDFNGDGKMDIIGYGHDLTYVGISTGSSFNTGLFSTTSAFTYTQGYNNNNVIQRLIGDMNGDGKDDVVAFGHHQTAVGISNGTSFTTSNWSGGVSYSAQTGGMSDMNKWPKMIGDFDGNGKDDVIGFGNTSVVVGLSTGTSFNNSTWTTAFTYGTDGFQQKKYPRYVGDFNGDGKDDIIGFGHDGVSVGISTGTSFNVSSWLTGEEFCYGSGWRVDARFIGAVSVGEFDFDDFEGNDVIRIVDANGDGKDDIVGFNGDGVFIAYSTGTYFQCPAHSSSYATVGNAVQPQYILDAAQFDITDDQIEIIGFGYSDVSVMDCNTCPTPVADAQPMNYSHIAQETGYQGWTVDVYNYCANTVQLDLTGTQCEDAYYIHVEEFNLGTWTTVTTIINQQWTSGHAPNTLNLSGLMTFVPNKLYRVVYAVGPVWSSEQFFIRIAAGPTAGMTALTSTPRSHNFFAAGQIKPVYPVCSNQVTVSINGSPSTCYTQYRYELIEVDAATMNTIGSPIIQIPSGGGWNNGPILVGSSMNASSIVLNKIYRLSVYVKNASGTISVAHRYLERTGCTYTPPKSGTIEETAEAFDPEMSVVYPNPTGGNEIFVQLADYGDVGAKLVFLDMDGKEILSSEVHSNITEKFDISGLSSGVYLVRIVGINRIENIRFIKN